MGRPGCPVLITRQTRSMNPALAQRGWPTRMAQGKGASRAARGVGPANFQIQKMSSYTVTLKKTEDGWRARCRALDLVVEGDSRKRAYGAMKAKIRERIVACHRRGEPIPRDETRTKFYRVNVEALKQGEALR